VKVFVSWSGVASRAAAELIKSWLPNVIQEVEVWISSQDIGKGEKWSIRLSENLTEIEFGLLMVTQENAKAPWIMFEAGALSKTVKARVVPILCDLERLDVANTPLDQFQNALVGKEEIWQVVEAVNAACSRALDPVRLRANYEKWWPDFAAQFDNIEFSEPDTKKESGSKTDSARLDKIEGALESIMSTLQRMRREEGLRSAATGHAVLLNDTLISQEREENKRLRSKPKRWYTYIDVKNLLMELEAKERGRGPDGTEPLA
jgi:hypothetical protein